MILHDSGSKDMSMSGNLVTQVFHPFLSRTKESSKLINQSNSPKKTLDSLLPIESYKILKKLKDNRQQTNSQSETSEIQTADSQIFAGLHLTQIIKTVLKSNYEKLLHQYEGTNKMFLDPDFPPVGTSIGGKWLTHNNWKRISEIIPNAVLIQEKIEPSDILQGQIGDCYFLSALAALAQNDYRIKNIFSSLQIQKNGIYMARILHKGILQQVVVDDYIPVNQKNQPLFARASGGNQVWVLILQKCWAKLHKSYAAISGGLPHEVLHAFSGAPTLYNSMPKNKAEQEALFQLLYQSDQNRAVICCGTKFDHQIQKKGLVVGHAYTLLEVYRSPYRLIKIRNPWGQKEWEGRASDKDLEFWKNISQQDKQKLGFAQKNDGQFFMVWEDFTQVFNMVDLCFVDDNASQICLNSQFQKSKGNLFELTVDTPGQFSHIQTELEKRRGYSKTTIIVSKFNQSKETYQYSFIKAGQYQALPDHYMTFENIQPGKYVFLVECSWLAQNRKMATISVYSASKMSLQEYSDVEPDKFLYQVFMDHARRNTKKRQTLSLQPLEWSCCQFLQDKCGYGYAAFHLDYASNTKLGIEIDEKQYLQRSLNLLKPYAGNGRMKTIVSPGQDLIVLFKLDPFKNYSSISAPALKVCRLMKE